MVLYAGHQRSSHLPGAVDICTSPSKHVKIPSYPKMGDCGCAPHPQSRSGRRPPFPQMGQHMPMQYDRRPPQARSNSPRTFPPQFRKGRSPSPELLGVARVSSRNLKATTRSPDFARLGTTMEELSKLEFVEMQNIEEDLRDFQLKRRKLVFNIASINLSKAKKSIKKAVSKMGL